MMDPETSAALRRAGRRAAIHLLRAGLESVKALEALIDELAKVGRDEEPADGGDGSERVRIDIE